MIVTASVVKEGTQHDEPESSNDSDVAIVLTVIEGVGDKGPAKQLVSSAVNTASVVSLISDLDLVLFLEIMQPSVELIDVLLDTLGDIGPKRLSIQSSEPCCFT